MTTTKRQKGGRKAARSKARAATSKPRAAKRATPARRTGARPRAAAKPAAAPKPRRPAARRSGAAAADAALSALKARFQRERGQLERRLTEAVREIGQLRHHELRAGQLERQLAERDAEIARLRAELGAPRPRPADGPRHDDAQQPSLAFGDVARDLDVFDDGTLDEDEEHHVL